MKPMEKFLLVVGLVVVLGAIVLYTLFDIEHIKGNEVGVLETWSGGVEQKSYPAKTYFFFPGFTQKMFKYPLSTQVFVMNDKSEKEGEKGSGREHDSYLVQSKEGQDMHVSLNLQWRIDPSQVVELHKTVRDNIEEVLIRPVVMRVVKDQATTRTAIEAYSGDGLVSLQNSIFKELSDPTGELRTKGVLVENFVIEGIRLNEAYIKEIVEKQVATQRALKAAEQTKAAVVEAQRAKAEAGADLEKAVVAAERDKQVAVLKAEAEAQQRIVDAKARAEQTAISAEAEQKRNVLIAEGEQKAMVARAQGILAQGKAESDVIQMKMNAYSAAGATNYVTMEVARSMSEGFKGINGYLPQDMKVNVLTGSFLDSLKGFMHPQPVEKK